MLDTPEFIVLCELLAYTNNIQFFETPGQGQWWYLHAMSEAEMVGGAAARCREGQKLDASSFFRDWLLDAFLLWRLAADPFSLFGGQEQDALLS